jgi:hypothetical protein
MREQGIAAEPEGSESRELMDRGFGIIAKAVMRDVSISWSARALYGLLTTYADDNGIAYPSVATLAEKAGASSSSIHNWLRELVEAGVIAREQQYAEDGRQQVTVTHLLDLVARRRGLQQDGVGAPPHERGEAPPRWTGGSTTLETNNTSSNNTSKEHTPTPPSGVVPPTEDRKEPARRLPSGWKPRLEDIAQMRSEFPEIATDEFLQIQTRNMIDWAESVDARKARWYATWRGWVRREAARAREREAARSGITEADILDQMTWYASPPRPEGMSEERYESWVQEQKRERALRDLREAAR